MSMKSDLSATLAEALAYLEGRQLSSVEFVMDYLQLRFDGPCLTAYCPPIVVKCGRQYAVTDSGYRDAICEQIGHRVHHINIDDKAVVVLFPNGSSIMIALESGNCDGPEALQFSLDEQHVWVA